jgi:DNA-binding NarL/FixJ family response regulator
MMRILIVEDSVLLREGIARLLGESGHEIVGQLVDASTLVTTVVDLHPDLVVLDVRLPPTFTDEGIRAALQVRGAVPTQPILVLSQYVEERYATELLASDSQGIGYLLKERVADVGDFVVACERVAAGGTVLDSEVVAQLLARRRRGPFDDLTPREREVLGLMAEGRSNVGIARHLVVSDGAVEKHISSIFSKLGLATSDTEHRRVLAVLQFLQHG